ncbi:hypothetical protein ACSHWI_16195, partial [Methylococcus sp. S2T]|uniref:hypothetical protein n=1 Tax=Methylococcus sp. S2T TaxID=3438967 RepID=UPI003EDB124B
MQQFSITLPDFELLGCADSEVPPDRKSMGCSSPDGNGIETLIAPGDGQIERLGQGRHPGTFHVFS